MTINLNLNQTFVFQLNYCKSFCGNDWKLSELLSERRFC